MNDDLISRQAALYAFANWFNGTENTIMELTFNECKSVIESLSSAQPETSKIENALHGKSAEEQYDFLRWLMQDYGMQFTDTRIAVIEWLRGENDG